MNIAKYVKIVIWFKSLRETQPFAANLSSLKIIFNLFEALKSSNI